MNNFATRLKDAVNDPQGIRGYARHVLRSGLLSTLAVAQRAREKRFVRCLYCHYVFDDQVDAFERVLIALKREGTFIDTDTCIRMARGEEEIEGQYFHLSFDDGFRNNLTNAVPILKRHQVPCLFFVPSGFVSADYETSRRYCLEIASYKGVIEMLKWRDLEMMLAAGFEIGSHTRTHARFSSISADPERMREEILGSKHELEHRLGFTCKSISWPYGCITDADVRSLEMVRQSSYQACFGAFRGTIEPVKTNLFAIPRHHFEAQWPLSHVKYFSRGHGEREHMISQ